MEQITIETISTENIAEEEIEKYNRRKDKITRDVNIIASAMQEAFFKKFKTVCRNKLNKEGQHTYFCNLIVNLFSNLFCTILLSIIPDGAPPEFIYKILERAAEQTRLMVKANIDEDKEK